MTEINSDLYLGFELRFLRDCAAANFLTNAELSGQDAVVVANHDRGHHRQVEQERGGLGGRRRCPLRDSG